VNAPESDDLAVDIRPLDKSIHNRAAFSCGVPELDDYLKNQSSQDRKRYGSVVYVGVIDTSTIVGYYSLSQYSVDLTGLPSDLAKHFPKYSEVPATLLGRLAVHENFQSRGFGELLLFDALKRVLDMTKIIASSGLVVDAKNDKAYSFYKRYGFADIVDVEKRLLLPMKTIAGMF
jgi:ribosomal protein S18 acetylase RimI-like enzyme